jgi:hypothetical protein
MHSLVKVLNVLYAMADIDFGHFLGNIEKFAGINRDRAPFVFTPEFAYIMGGKGSDHYRRFVDLCCRAYNILRHNSGLFLNLLNLVCCSYCASCDSAAATVIIDWSIGFCAPIDALNGLARAATP